MGIWILIMGALLAGTVLAIIYLSSRFYRFSYAVKIAGAHKKLRIVVSVIPVILIIAVSWIVLGSMNAIIIMLHLLGIWLICDLLSFIWKKIRKKEQTAKHYYAGVAAIVITVVYLAAGWYLAHHVWETQYTVSTDKKVGELRVVQLADSHVGTTFDGKGFAKQVRRMQKTNPDVVVVTGDFVDDDTTKEDMIASCKALGTLNTTYGVYFVFGNHDKGYYDPSYRGYSGDDLVKELEKNHVRVLQDENVLIDDRFYIIGRQDRSEKQMGKGRASMKDLVKGLDTSKYMIVLDHQPHDYDAQKQVKVDMVLSGHTHGGQLFPFNDVGEWTGENAKTYGLAKRDNTNFIVTSGISDWAIKFKTGCKSEYVVIDIKG